MGRGLYAHSFNGIKGNISTVLPEGCDGIARINGEVFIAPNNQSKNKNYIYVLDFYSLTMKRKLQLMSPLWGSGLGTDGAKLFVRLANDPYMIKEIDIQTGETLKTMVKPEVNISEKAASSFYIDAKRNLLYMTDYKKSVYCFDTITGKELAVVSFTDGYPTGVTITNGFFIVSVYKGSSPANVYYAKIPDYENFGAEEFSKLNFTLYNYGSVITGCCSIGSYMLFTKGDVNIAYLDLEKIIGKEASSERFLIHHDNKYKTFNLGEKTKSLTSLVPVMTTNNSNGIAASSPHDGAYEAFRVFDGLNNTAWVTAKTQVRSWLSYEFVSPTIFNSYALLSREENVGESPRAWDLEAWNGSRWITLDKRRNEVNWNKNEVRTYHFPNTNQYKKIRWRFYENNGSVLGVALREIKLFHLIDSGWIELSKPKHMNFVYAHGISDLNQIKKEDWSLLSASNSKVKLLRYTHDLLSDMSEDNNILYVAKNASRRVVKTQFTPLSQISIPLGNISINDDVEKYTIELTKEYKDNIRLFVSFDNGMKWESYRQGKWKSLDITDENDMKKNGMRTWEFESLRTEDFKTKAIFGFIKIGFMFDTKLNEKGSVDVDSVKASINTYMKGARVSDASLYILNTTSTINLSFVGNKLSGTLSDYDLGLVQYRVFLNDKPYYPLSGEFTNLHGSPEAIALNIKNTEVKIGEKNTLVVEFKDYWGSVDSWTTHFIGTYAGLMFSDNLGKYYTTDIGEILKYWNTGTLVAGQISKENKITLTNMYGHKVTNIEVKGMNSDLPNGVRIELSKEQFPFTSEEVLNWNTILDYNQSVEFFARLATELTANSVPSGKFEIRARAQKI
ncbi:discoidin domain-containing protein [Paenibacillus alvei]|nr:discoidin domain-containing protein [Paenibacillus alvei]MCY9705113.1 discoidin domain-containing protein [Paenibacillus alvei]MCY9737787.1 discoidin domain-containing protein [Paenibacillus alvei]MCY9756136.1 discoidin domain-containing protein [Paenibacillus alvei]MEC0080045.1 discoidin domain-containing protein [Paenibacillus alvei]